MTDQSTALTVPNRTALARSELRPLPQRVRYPSAEEFKFITDMAKTYAEEDMFKDLGMKAGAITAVALKGYELGVPFMAALDGIRIIKGRPTLSASLMEALAEQRVPGAYLEWVATGEDGVATCVAHRAGRPSIRLSFTWDEAKRAGLTQKDTYQKYPADLLRAGVTRKICKMQYAGVYFGFDLDVGLGVDTAEGTEFIDTVAEQVFETPVPAAAEPPPPVVAPPAPAPVAAPSAAAPPAPVSQAPPVAATAPAAAPTPPAAPSAPTHPTDRLLQFTTGPFIGKHLSDLNEKEIRQLARGFLASLDKAKTDKNEERIDNYSKWLELVEQWAGFRRIKLAPAGTGA